MEHGILIPMDSEVRRFEVKNGVAYIVSADSILQIIDVSDPELPVKIDEFGVDGQSDVAVCDDVLAVFQDNVLSLYRIEDLDSVSLLEDIPRLDISGPYDDLAKRYGSVYCHLGRILTLDLVVNYRSPPPYTSIFHMIDTASIDELTEYRIENYGAKKIVGAEKNLIFTQRSCDIVMVDIEDLTNIHHSAVDLNGVGPMLLSVVDRFAYFIRQTGSTEYPLALCISEINPSLSESAEEIAYFPFTGRVDLGVTVYPKALSVEDNMVYVALIGGDLLVFDVTNPSLPELKENIDSGMIDPIGIPEIELRDMHIVGDKAFIGCSEGLLILNVGEGG